MKYSESDKQLFNETGIYVEDRHYTEEEIERFKIKVTDYIMSQSSKSKILNKIDIPVLIVFGDKDDCVLTQPKEIIINYLENNINNCKIEIIKDTNHMYDNKYEELGKRVSENI